MIILPSGGTTLIYLTNSERGLLRATLSDFIKDRAGTDMTLQGEFANALYVELLTPEERRAIGSPPPQTKVEESGL